ncbi:MAG TPA: potassium transporter TrkG [Flavobacteriaceae bacterium]|nr:potassium transporter TrkG [Flavobacteriaceae bacterium]
MFENFKKSKIIIWVVDLVLVCLLVFTYGFERFEAYKSYTILALPILFLLLIGVNLYQFKTSPANQKLRKTSKINIFLLGFLLILETIVVAINMETTLLESYVASRFVLEYGLFIYFFIRLTFLVRKIYSAYFNPALLFVSSFALVALTGTFLLMLPGATTEGITFIDALFTATSAVAVTGLIVVDTAAAFTTFGHSVILILIQIGGLGMLTFTSFFAYFFKTGSTFSESLYMKDIMGNEQLGNVMRLTMEIVLFAIVVEIIGALFVFSSLNNLSVVENRGFFALFHAISAFCNAGFSLSSNNLMGEGLQFNYYLQWILMALIVFGGLGYGIARNFIIYAKKFVVNLFTKGDKTFISRVITLNTKIVVFTTGVLIFVGGLFFWFSEKQSVLAMHDTFFGKLTTALFSSITPRTAGFNTFDFAEMTVPGILVIILLMWIGASPASTGGGIKTTTFALATLNVFSLAKGKENIEIGTRRVPKEAVQKAFAIMVISLIAIGVGILMILIFDPQFTLLQVAFEVFSAYSTVGLTLGITGGLSTASKLVVILLMLFGRIGVMNILIGILKHRKTTQYKYPKENILIT